MKKNTLSLLIVVLISVSNSYAGSNQVASGGSCPNVSIPTSNGYCVQSDSNGTASKSGKGYKSGGGRCGELYNGDTGDPSKCGATTIGEEDTE
jgi:hypothetical protein